MPDMIGVGHGFMGRIYMSPGDVPGWLNVIIALIGLYFLIQTYRKEVRLQKSTAMEPSAMPHEPWLTPRLQFSLWLILVLLACGSAALNFVDRGWNPPTVSRWLYAIGGLAIVLLLTAWAMLIVRTRKPPQNVAMPSLVGGLYVSDMRFNFTSLSERHGEWSMRVFNGTGRAVEFSGLSGRIKFNAPNNADPSHMGELPEPSARADMAQTVGPFKEWLVILSQRVPAAEADKLSAMLAADTPILFNLSDLTIKVCAQDDRQKIERLPIWGGVSYSRGFGFGQIIRATAHLKL